MEPVLNERSLEPAQLPTVERMKSLVDVLRRLDTLGFPRVLRHARKTTERDVEVGTSLHTWLFQRAPRDLRQFLAGRMSKAPFVEELHGMQEDSRGSLLQVSVDDEPAVGAGVAYLTNAPAVALRGQARWEVDPLVLLLTKVDEEDGDCVERRTTVEIVHVCRPEQVDAREQLLRERLLCEVSSGDDLWQRRRELFPRLDFCASVERQVCTLSGKEFYFDHVVAVLSRLDAALPKWASGPLHPGMDSSGESSSTLTHGNYGPMGQSAPAFLCPSFASCLGALPPPVTPKSRVVLSPIYPAAPKSRVLLSPIHPVTPKSRVLLSPIYPAAQRGRVLLAQIDPATQRSRVLLAPLDPTMQ